MRHIYNEANFTGKDLCIDTIRQFREGELYYFHVIESRDCLLLQRYFKITETVLARATAVRGMRTAAVRDFRERRIPETLLPAFRPHKRNTSPCGRTSRFRLGRAERGVSRCDTRIRKTFPAE